VVLNSAHDSGATRLRGEGVMYDHAVAPMLAGIEPKGDQHWWSSRRDVISASSPWRPQPKIRDLTRKSALKHTHPARTHPSGQRVTPALAVICVYGGAVARRLTIEYEYSNAVEGVSAH